MKGTSIEGWDTEKTIAPGEKVLFSWVKKVTTSLARRRLRVAHSFVGASSNNSFQSSTSTAPDVSGLNRDESIHLSDSRINGRWESGAPINISPLFEDEALSADPMRRNNINYDHPKLPGFDMKTTQTMCPFSAHILRSRPRGHNKPEHPTSHMMGGGLPYGPEGMHLTRLRVVRRVEANEYTIVTDKEAAAVKTMSDQDPSLERGMAFGS
ncbi:dye-decolorizing heme-containing peroxidase [Marasmius sp. AFHP31]|nr:dye-decolorizing heme-containing peroxidase [Marasmius sp. AFHP31]